MQRLLIAIPFLALALSGCDGLLDESPESFLAPENFYRSVADADAAVLSTYHPLVVYPELRVRAWAAMDAGSDVAIVGPLEPNPNTRVTGVLAYDAGSPFVTGAWERYYQSITRANLAIDRIPGINMDAGRRAALVGEAKFMRALSYFYLARLYGGVPLVISSTDLGLDVARAPVEEVYAQIARDAEEAAASLPATRASNSQGRATRGSALALLADLHLYRGEWQKAADRAKQLIDSGTYSLFPNYLEAFLPATENGREHIFSLQANGPGSRPVATSFAAMYFPREVRPGRGGGWGMLLPTPWHFNSYLPGDYRKEVGYQTRWTDITGKVFNVTPHVYKYRPSNVTEFVWGDVNVPIYRYAEVLLMYAEALNELGRPAEAVTYLNQIRARARRGAGNETRAQPADYAGSVARDAVREAIYQERRWEFAHEGKRWFDLKRRGADYFVSQIRANDPEATDLEATDMLWPIPQEEIDANPALKQNPGY